MTGNYVMHGKMLLMPLSGNGTCRGNFSELNIISTKKNINLKKIEGDVDATTSIVAERVMKNNGQHLKVKALFVDFNIGTAEIRLEDLFDGNSELGEAMNNFLNDNWKIVAAEIRPAIEDSIAHIVKSITERLFDEYTLDQLLPE